MSDVVFLCPGCLTGQRLSGDAVPRRVRCSVCEKPFKLDGFLFDRTAWEGLYNPFAAVGVAIGMGCAPSPRKWRLLACAVARPASEKCRNPWFREAVRKAELWIEEGRPPRGVSECRGELARAALPLDLRGQYQLWETIDLSLAADFARTNRAEFGWVLLAQRCIASDPRLQPEDMSAEQGPLAAEILRDLVPNPFLPLTWNANWFTSTVRDLAAHIYESREFTAMPILADALQDAGCDDEQILTHCRAEKPHARGCWVLDAILGKT